MERFHKQNRPKEGRPQSLADSCGLGGERLEHQVVFRPPLTRRQIRLYTLLCMRSSRPTSSLWSPLLQSSRPLSGFRRAKTEVLFGPRRVVNIGTTVTEHSAWSFPISHLGSLIREAPAEGIVQYVSLPIAYKTSLVLTSGSRTCLVCKSQKVSLLNIGPQIQCSSPTAQFIRPWVRSYELDVSPGLSLLSEAHDENGKA